MLHNMPGNQCGSKPSRVRSFWKAGTGHRSVFLILGSLHIEAYSRCKSRVVIIAEVSEWCGPRNQVAAGHDLRILLRTGPLGSNTLGEVPEDKYEFDEGAAQVQRLLQRDRKELTGIEEIGAGFKTEFDEGESSEKEEEAVTSTSGRSNGSAPTAGPSLPLLCILVY